MLLFIVAALFACSAGPSTAHPRGRSAAPSTAVLTAPPACLSTAELRARQADRANQEAAQLDRALAARGWTVVPVTTGPDYGGELTPEQLEGAEGGWSWLRDR